MITLESSVVCFAILTAFSGAAHAQLVNCKPAKDCTAAGKPCKQYIAEGSTKSITPHAIAGTPIFRVRVCGASLTDVCPGKAATTQSVTVFAYDKGGNQLYLKSLGSLYDTGPSTEIKNLSKLSVRCNSTVTAYCTVVWQVCKKALPLSIK